MIYKAFPNNYAKLINVRPHELSDFKTSCRLPYVCQSVSQFLPKTMNNAQVFEKNCNKDGVSKKSKNSLWFQFYELHYREWKFT